GKVPFRAAGREATLRQVCNAQPVPPRRLRPNLPVDLEAITLKCLQKPTAQRYSSARALADDLQRFLDGAAVHPSFPRRRGWLIGAACALLLVGALVLWAALTGTGDPAVAEPADVRWQRQALARLRAGEAVTLLGDKGQFAWWRWAVGEHGARLVRADD